MLETIVKVSIADPLMSSCNASDAGRGRLSFDIGDKASLAGDLTDRTASDMVLIFVCSVVVTTLSDAGGLCRTSANGLRPSK